MSRRWICAVVLACGCNFAIRGLSPPDPQTGSMTGFADLASFPVGGDDLASPPRDLATVATTLDLAAPPDLVPSCPTSCATTCNSCCRDACGAGANCNLNCSTKGCACDFTCETGSMCMANCSGGSSCAVAVQAGLTVTVSCSGKSTCNVDCRTAVSCTVNCSRDSNCSCAGTGCAFNQCTPTTCPNGVKVCGRPCP